MKTTAAERQRKHREKRRGLNLALVQVWVPQDRVTEIKSISTHMTEELSQNKGPNQRQLNKTTNVKQSVIKKCWEFFTRNP